MPYIIKTIGSKVTLNITMIKSGQGLTGLSPTVEIRRMSDGAYLDFSAIAAPFWISSGGQQRLTLPETAWLPGYYVWEFDQAVYEDGGSREEYTVIYRHDPPYRTLLTEVLAFELEAEYNIKRILQHLENEQDLVEHSNERYEHKVYDDGGAAGNQLIHHAEVKRSSNVETRRHLP